MVATNRKFLLFLNFKKIYFLFFRNSKRKWFLKWKPLSLSFVLFSGLYSLTLQIVQCISIQNAMFRTNEANGTNSKGPGEWRNKSEVGDALPASLFSIALC